MKKIAILLTLCMFILVGCSGNTEPASVSAPTKIKLSSDEMVQVFEEKYQELLDAGIKCKMVTDEVIRYKYLYVEFIDSVYHGSIGLAIVHVYEDNSLHLLIDGGYGVRGSHETLSISKMYVKSNDNTVKFDDMRLAFYDTRGDQIAEKIIDSNENIESLIDIFKQNENVQVILENSDSTNQFDITFPKEMNKNMLAILGFYKELQAEYDVQVYNGTI